MEISKLKTLTTPDLNDVLPILDINGGVSGKPILRKATLGSLLSLVETNKSASESLPGFTVPTTIKIVAATGDYFIGIDADGAPYKITKADLLAGLTSGSASDTGESTKSTFSDIVLLLPFDGSINDVKNHVITSVGSPSISSIYKYGNGSLRLDGNSYLSISNASDLALDNSDFTIECWIYPNFSNQVKVVANHRSSYLYDQAWSINTYHPGGIGKLSFFANNGNQITLNSSFEPPINTWSHVAVTRLGNIFTLYGNGISAGTTNSTLAIQNTNSDICIGYAPDSPSEKWQGLIDDFRISKRCIYSSNFSPPGKLPITSS